MKTNEKERIGMLKLNLEVKAMGYNMYANCFGVSQRTPTKMIEKLRLFSGFGKENWKPTKREFESFLKEFEIEVPTIALIPTNNENDEEVREVLYKEAKEILEVCKSILIFPPEETFADESPNL